MWLNQNEPQDLTSERPFFNGYLKIHILDILDKRGFASPYFIQHEGFDKAWAEIFFFC